MHTSNKTGNSVVIWLSDSKNRLHLLTSLAIFIPAFIFVLFVIFFWPTVAGGAQKKAVTPFTDCPLEKGCPEMLAMPGSPSGFHIGSRKTEKHRQSDEDRFPVSVKPFAISKYEVTVKSYMACVSSTVCKPPEWLEPGNQSHVETGVNGYYRRMEPVLTDDAGPIVGVSYNDAIVFADWLSIQTGKPYRLPSEAEWEFAARAGTPSAYWWGDIHDKDSKAWANCSDCGSKWDGRSPAPVGSFPANPWGLHDMHGNVWEWVADYYCNSYASGPSDGSARQKDDCEVKDAKSLRVLRGGSTFYGPKFMRSSIRLRNKMTFRNSSVGFRIARDL